MIKKSKYSSEVMKKHFNQELAMTKEDNKNFKKSTKFRSMIRIMLIMMLKEEIIVIYLENRETLGTRILISISN